MFDVSDISVTIQGFRVRRHRQPQNNGSRARRCRSHPIAPWQNRVKTLRIGGVGV